MSVAIVTGASSGIGAATARLLADAGYDVGITYRANRDGAEQVAGAIVDRGRRAAVAQLDLEAPAEAQRAVTQLAEALDPPSVLVNNAATNPRVAVLDASVDDWQACLDANLVGPWACARAAARLMIDAGHDGRIVNVTSILAFVPLEGGAPYCAAKAGLEMLTKVMALELASHGIRVNAVAPGHVITPMNYRPTEVAAAAAPKPGIPLGRAASAEELAQAVVFLADPASSYATGASLLVDGGLMLASGPQQLQRATGLPASARRDP